MSVANPWFEQAQMRGAAIDDWLQPNRKNALALLENKPWPGRKIEDWKYTSVYGLSQAQFDTNTNPGNDAAPQDVVEGLNAVNLFLQDGVLQAASDSLPEGVSLVRFADANESQRKDILAKLSNIKPERHLFGLLNDALLDEGLFLQIAAGVNVEPCIRIVHKLSEQKEAHHRVLCLLGENAKASIAEQFIGDKSSFNTAFFEADIAPNAKLTYYRFALQTGLGRNIGGCHFKLHEKSELDATVVGFGSEISRIDTDIIHAGEHANAKLNAIYLLKDKELFDLHATVEHVVPNGTTEENVRGIVADKATAVFNGRIHIHRDAQKTLAELHNRNLLLSRGAQIYTKPELEIYADDVRCAHGATIAETDKQAMYYLTTRGINNKTAQLMLNFGFINELVEQMPNEALIAWLREQLQQRFLAMAI